MNEGETVNYNGKTYQLFGDVIKVTADGAEDQLFANQSESTNIVELGEEGDTVYIPVVDNTLDLAAGVAALADGKTVIYGDEESYEGNYTIALAGDSEYALTKNDEAEIEGLTVDASGVEGEVTLTTDFAAQVATAENATITVNGASYTAAEGALTIDATEDASTLFNGTVALLLPQRMAKKQRQPVKQK